MRRSLEDLKSRKNQEETGHSLSREESDGFGSSEKVISQNLKAFSSRSLDSQSKLGITNPVHPLSRPGSANGHVPSIVMLTSVDHSDATKYILNPIFRL